MTTTPTTPAPAQEATKTKKRSRDPRPFWVAFDPSDWESSSVHTDERSALRAAVRQGQAVSPLQPGQTLKDAREHWESSNPTIKKGK